MPRQILRATLCLAAIAIASPLILAQTAPAPPPAQPPMADQPFSSLAAQISTLLADPAVARDHWGIMVTSLDGAQIFALNEAQLFQPASNTKLYTTSAAVALLGPERRFTTRVEYGSAGSSNKTVNGNVVIIGAGDSNLSDRELPYRAPSEQKTAPPPATTPLHFLAEFADQIAAAGVKHIKGDIVGDDTVFPWEPYAQDWSIDDMVWGYGAPVSGLTINDNQLQLTVAPGKSVGKKPTLAWQDGMPAYYTLDTTGLLTGAPESGSHVQMECAPGSRVLRVYGSIATDSEPDVEEIAITDPAEYAAIALKGMLEARGIKVDGIAKAKHRLIEQGTGFRSESHQLLPQLPQNPMTPAVSSLLTGSVSCSDACPVILQHTSPPLLEDIVLTNKISQNLHAELFLRHLGKTYGQPYTGGDGGIDGSLAEGARVIRQFLLNAGLAPDDFVFFDGSGLSGHDLVTPRATAKLLQFATTQPWFAAWRSSLPIGGEDGSLASRFPQSPLKDHVFAKTGTLSEARALSGYLDAASGRTVIFSIMVGNHLPGTDADRIVMDKIVAAIQAAE